MATRLINIPRLDVGSKKPLKTRENIQSGDYAEIYINLYENSKPKSFSVNAKFTAYGMLYKSKQVITPIPNSQFNIIDAEQGQLCLLLTPQETKKNDVLMLQISITDNNSSIHGHHHGTTHYCTQYFLITILKSQCPGEDVEQIYDLIFADDDSIIITDDGYYIEV